MKKAEPYSDAEIEEIRAAQDERPWIGDDEHYWAESESRWLATLASRDKRIAELEGENEELHKGRLTTTTLIACPGCGAGTRPRYMRDGRCLDCCHARITTLEALLGKAADYVVAHEGLDHELAHELAAALKE